MRIELVGGLGVGKSTLCHALDKIGFHSIYETLSTNPFLADCFADPENFRFSSQMWFILSKFHEILKHAREDHINVLDQSVLNVRAYTNILFKNEDAAALAIVNQCFAYLEERAGPADLLIHLICSPEAQLRRIRNRNRRHEISVDMAYIITLQAEIDRLLETARAASVKIIEIDTEEIYLPDNFVFAETLALQVADKMGLSTDEILNPEFSRQYSLAG